MTDDPRVPRPGGHAGPSRPGPTGPSSGPAQPPSSGPAKPPPSDPVPQPSPRSAGHPPSGPAGPPPSGPTGSSSTGPGGGHRPVLNGALTLRPSGIWLVTSLELRQRIRSVRWYVALSLWMLVLIGIGLLVLGPTAMISGWNSIGPTAAVVFSLQMILVLFAMLLVIPALSAGSINGDRTAGTLATLQASLLSPLEITLGKLLAGWVTGLAFLVLAMPSVLPTALLGGVGVLYLLRALVMIAALALCITAIGLGLSALTARQLGSVVLAYVVVFGVTVVAPIIWGTSAAFLQQEREVTTYSPDYSDLDDGAAIPTCVEQTQDRTIVRLDISQPLMWPNPVVLLADVAPTADPDALFSGEENVDALQILQAGMRYATNPNHPQNFNSCSEGDPGYPEHLGQPADRPIWPLGLGLWVLAGAGSVALTTWRLAVPIRVLGKGIRIA